MEFNSNYEDLLAKASALYDKKNYIELEAFLNQIYEHLNFQSPDDLTDFDEHSYRYKILELYFQVSSLLKNKSVSDVDVDKTFKNEETDKVESNYPEWEADQKVFLRWEKEKLEKVRLKELKEKERIKKSRKEFTELFNSQIFSKEEPERIRASIERDKIREKKKKELKKEESDRKKRLSKEVAELRSKEKLLKKGGWLAQIVSALSELGGEAHLSQIYYKVKLFRRENSYSLDSLESVIRKEIYIRTPGLKAFRNKDYVNGRGYAMNAKPTFYLAGGIGKGRFGLISSRKNL